MQDILRTIVEANAAELAAAKAARPCAEVRAAALDTPPPPSFTAALRATPFPAVIAELKCASPSKGVIRAELDCAALAAELEGAGAAALSVLTEPHYFRGSLGNLRRARAACGLPLLRKEFIVDEYQIAEAREAGASAVLLIAALLDDARLRALCQCAHGFGLAVLAEAHTEAELERVLRTDADAVGVNARDLHTFRTSLDLSAALIRRIPAGRLRVAESAIASHEDLRALRTAGADAFLIGETLMRAPSPGRKLRELRNG